MEETRRHSRFSPSRSARILFSAGCIIFIFEYFVIPQFASASHSLHLLSEVNPLLVIVAVGFEVASIGAYAELTRTVFSPHSLPLNKILRVNLSTLAVSHIVPGGTAAAGALSYRMYSELGVPPATNAFGLAVQGSGSAVVLNIMFWMALVVSIPLRGFNPAYGYAALAGVLLMLAFFGTVAMLTRGQRTTDGWLRALARHVPWLTPDRVSQMLATVAERIRLLTSNRRTLWASLEWASANWILDAACLWTFLWAFGHPISPIDLLVAYGLANILAVIPITPGGLGIVEGVLIPTIIGFGVPGVQATLAVLAYRFLNFWLPIPLGGAAYLSMGVGKRRRAHDPAVES
jgi:putative heme transporter